MTILNLVNKKFDSIFENQVYRNSTADSHQKIQTSSANFKSVLAMLKTMSLISFMPYAILGMLYVNKSYIFIPCLVLSTLSVLLAMYSTVKIQLIQQNVEGALENISESFKEFIEKNQSQIQQIKGIEILENSIKSTSQNNVNSQDFINHELISSSLVKGAMKISQDSKKSEFANINQNLIRKDLLQSKNLEN